MDPRSIPIHMLPSSLGYHIRYYRGLSTNVNETFMFVGSHEKHLLSFVIHLSAYITAASTGQISLKFDTGDLHENLS